MFSVLNNHRSHRGKQLTNCTTPSCADALNLTHSVLSAGQQKLSIIIMQMLIHPDCLRCEQRWLLSQHSQPNVISQSSAGIVRIYQRSLKALNELNYAFIRMSESECIPLISLCPKLPSAPPRNRHYILQLQLPRRLDPYRPAAVKWPEMGN